ncbi:MAG: methylated-DNA--[protein]-cysteine S-methyltransferase [Fimbriimonadaceae bacterium]|jgi:methylated-DNA-[protein]-cysteine S-methyltransferase|nr:methylated-DNA--[protein]-cysteine S-methyltransferase [Fimbriimonadaceae bacterium]
MDFYKTTMSSPVEELLLVASDAGLRALLWVNEAGTRVKLPPTRAARHPILDQAVHELSEYFAGTRREFTVKLDPVGTEFQHRVWQTLREIPYGQTRSYLDQAKAIGDLKTIRAVGAANGKNPISILVPCHRVVGKNGSLVGFAGGLEAKEYLLRHEGVLL